MKVTYRVHAVRRMFERGISEAEVRRALERGEEIASYPDDKPYASRLLLGWKGERPLHVVAAYNAQDDEEIVIMVYEPDAAMWEDGFKRRRS
jgi:SOS response regulatory protein OraA/RecX